MTTLVRSGHPGSQDPDRLDARVRKLEALLAERAAEISRVEAELAAFKIHYSQKVGWLHEELDELERAIAEAELGELARHTNGDPSGRARQPRPRRETLPRYTSDEVRTLFRDVAKIIHPDLAGDEPERDRRHRLMIEANHAYARGDEERLRWILQAWKTGPDAVRGEGPEAARERLVRRIAQLEEQALTLAGELDTLKDSPMWRLKGMVDEAAGKGRDLVREMVERLKVDIMVARNRLEAIQTTP